MEILLGIIFEFILEGSFEAVTSKNVHPIVRILLALLLFAVYGGIVLLSFWLGMKKNSPLCLVIGILLPIFFIWGFYAHLKKKQINITKQYKGYFTCE